MPTPETHFRSGVDLRLMSPQILFAWQVAAICFAEEGLRCEATSLRRDAPFAVAGYHATGNAIDLGLRDEHGAQHPLEASDRIVARLRGWIGREGGGQFDIVDEARPGASAGWTGPHIHIEFDPK
jgi:hypothetical protein